VLCASVSILIRKQTRDPLTPTLQQIPLHDFSKLNVFFEPAYPYSSGRTAVPEFTVVVHVSIHAGQQKGSAQSLSLTLT